jgi:ATP-dependent DNA helicase RecG
MTVLSDVEDTAQWIVALANTNGGFLQVSDEKLINRAIQQTKPLATVLPTTKHETFYVPRSSAIHAFADGSVFVEALNGLQRLDTQGIQRLATYKQVGDFERELVENASREDLDTDLDDEELESLGYTVNGKPTVASILLYSPYPQRWLPQSAIQVVRYPAKHSTVELTESMSGMIRIVDKGTIAELLDATLKQMRHPSIPEAAIREAVTNAVIHREYRILGPVIVSLYTDGLQVSTPGGLPAYVTEETMFVARFCRNPLVKRGVERMGYRTGQPGMQVIESSGLTISKYNSPQNFSLTLYNVDNRASTINNNPDNEEQHRILQYVQEYGSITERELRAIFPEMPLPDVKHQLNDLVARGQLIKLEPASGTARYVAPDIQAE